MNETNKIRKIKVIPSLSDKGYISNPMEVVDEILKNYVRGSSRQSVMFETRSLMADLADSDNNITAQKNKIYKSLHDLFSRSLDNVKLETDFNSPELIFNVSWTYDGVNGSRTDINLNDYSI